MTTVRCDKMASCVRVLGHAGCCTACPSAATLDWDVNREAIAQHHIDAAVSLLALDFPSPPWADLRDE
jgi:hypothetical protein